MATIYIREITYKEKNITDKERANWIRISEAAELAGADLNYIRHLMAEGKLTVAVFDPLAMEPRYVLRSEVEALPAHETKRRLKPGETPLNRLSGAKRAKAKAERAAKEE